MQFTKLFNSILDSTIWQEPVETKIVWITMLAMVDMRGEVQSSIPGLAKRAGVTLDQCEQALECFRSPDKYSRTQEHEGRRIRDVDGGWELMNHGKYRALLSAEERREYNRRKQAEYREAKKGKKSVDEVSLTVIDNVSNAHITEAETEAETENSKDVYPLPPNGGGEGRKVLPDGYKKLTKAEQARKKVLVNNKMMKSIGKFYNRPEENLWTIREAVALQEINPSPEEVDQMEAYYLACIDKENDIRRKDLQTLLNNWSSELDRATIYNNENH